MLSLQKSIKIILTRQNMKRIGFLGLIFLNLFFIKNIYAQEGTDCSNPYTINMLPFLVEGFNTDYTGNNYDADDACNSNYISGNDFVFKYVNYSNKYVKIDVTDTDIAGVGLFVMDGCPDDTATECICIKESALGNPTIDSLYLIAGETYYFIISTNNFLGSNPTTPFDIKVIELFEYDAELLRVNFPTSDCELFTQDSVSITVKNVGFKTLTTINVNYTLNIGIPVNETLHDTLLPNDTLQHTFSQLIDVSEVKTHNLTIGVIAANDANIQNNNTAYSFTHKPVIDTFPYTEDFEDWNGGWTAGGTNSSWERGTPNNTHICYAASGGKAYATSLSGNCNNNEDSYIQGPCFDFSELNNPILELKIWKETYNFLDGAWIEISNDGGMNWEKLGNTDDPNNWYNQNNQWAGSSSGWLTAKHHLNNYAGMSDIKIRLRYKASIVGSSEGFAVDDIKIYACDTVAANFSFLQNDSKLEFTNESEHADTYFWDFDDGNFSTSKNPTYSYSKNGEYNVCCIAENHCSADTFCQSVSITTSINDRIKKIDTYNLYPNPANNFVKIYGDIAQIKHIDIYNSKGILIKKNISYNNKISINYPSGLYFLKIYLFNNQIVLKPLVIQ